MDVVLRRTGFWFLRHGETDWNAQNLSQGTTDVPLNAHGLQQAHTIAPLLLGRGIASIVASPLQRARVTAEIVGAELGLPVEVQTDLHEVSFGVMEAKPMMAAWFTDWVEGRATPDGAESFAALKRRAVGAVGRALDNPPLVLVVAHGALFRALRAAMGLEPNVRLQNATPTWCEPPGDGDGPWSLIPATAPVVPSAP
ncbi:MAG TPA: histidine phosphatase family protein [Acidisphaera sp.]|nr:histidine phosphatase family protein [Acidisphaera sp.]